MSRKNRRQKSATKKPKKVPDPELQPISNQTNSIIKPLLFLVILMSLSVLHSYYKSEPSSFEVTEDTILLQYAKVIKAMVTAHDNLNKDLKEEPLLLTEFMQLRLRPIQERLASMRTQTGIYEKMKRIPGGPTNFMNTTLAELNALKYEIESLHQELLNTVVTYTVRKDVLNFKLTKVVQHQKTLKDMFYTEDNGAFFTLKDQGIDLIPQPWFVSYSKKESVPSTENLSIFTAPINGIMSPLDLAAKLEVVGNLFKEKKLLGDEITARCKNLGCGDLLDELLDDIDKVANDLGEGDQHELAEKLYQYGKVNRDIADILEKDGEHFNSLTLPWIQKANKIVSNLSGALVTSMEKDDLMRDPRYFKLKNIILRDIFLVEQRVKNLQYTFIKVDLKSVYV